MLPIIVFLATGVTVINSASYVFLKFPIYTTQATVPLNHWLQVFNHIKFVCCGIKPGICVMRTAPAATNVTSKLQSISKRTPSHLEQPNTIMIAGVFWSWYLTIIISKDHQ